MLYYCKIREGNFGDDLNPWLWSRLAPEFCDEQNPALLVGIGTIFTCRIPEEPLKMVFGSGCWGRGPLPELDERWKIYCVRGPLTAARLKLDPALALVDPGILVRRFARVATTRKYRVSFMPHQSSMSFANWDELCRQVGFHCIDPQWPVDRVLQDLQETNLLLSEAMHGAIAADALRVPWIPLRLYSRFDTFKWQDWTRSIGVPWKLTDVAPIYLNLPKYSKRVGYFFKKGFANLGLGREGWKRHGVWRSTPAQIQRSLEVLSKIPENQPAFLSEDKRLDELEERLLEKLSQLRADWAKLLPAESKSLGA